MAVNDFTGKNIQDTYQKVVQTDGTNLADGTGSLLPISFDGNNVIISGSLIATEYSVSSSVTNIVIATKSGSTAFGNSADDTHTFTGNITSSNNISASNFIYAKQYFSKNGYRLKDSDGTSRHVIAAPGNYLNIGNTNFAGINLTGSLITNGNIEVGLGLTTTRDITSGTHITAGTNITASGDISASGTIQGANLIAASLKNNSNENLIRYHAASDSVRVGITTNNTNPLSLQGHVTASGNISASGTILANKIESDNLFSRVGDANTGIQLGSDTVVIEGNNVSLANFTTSRIELNRPITASGNISSSDKVIADEVHTDSIQSTGTSANLYTDASFDELTIGNNGESRLKINSHITASGNISASATSYIQTPELRGTGTTATLEVSGIISSSEFRTTGNITSSGNISSSGLIQATNGFYAGASTRFVATGTDTAAIQKNDGGSLTSLQLKANQITGQSGFAINSNNLLINHITASGDISSSGIITAKDGTNNGFHIGTGEVALDANSNDLRLGVDATWTGITIGKANAPTKNISFHGPVTASGEISASGHVYGYNFVSHGVHQIGYDTNAGSVNIGPNTTTPVKIHGNVTASGNISASGDIVADQYNVDGHLALNTDGSVLGRVFPAQGITNIQIGRQGSTNRNIELLGPVTASGNISASGDIIGEEFKVNGLPLASSDVNNNILIGNSNDNPIVIGRAGITPVLLNGPVTASGDISSSGDIFAGHVRAATNFGLKDSGGTFRHFARAANSTNELEIGNTNFTDGIVLTGNVTASGNISASHVSTISGGTGSFRRLLLGNTDVDTLTAELHIRNAGSVNINLDSFDQNGNQIINFLNNQEPDFSIGNYFSDGGFQIRSDRKAFLIVGADEGNEIKTSGSLNVTSHITASGNISASGNVKANYIETAKIPLIQYISTDDTSTAQSRLLDGSHTFATNAFYSKTLEWDTPLFEDTDFFETGSVNPTTTGAINTFAVKQTGRYEINCNVAFKGTSGARPGLNVGIYTSSMVSQTGSFRPPGPSAHAYVRFSGNAKGSTAAIPGFVLQLISGSAVGVKVDLKTDWGGVGFTFWSGSLSHFSMKKIG